MMRVCSENMITQYKPIIIKLTCSHISKDLKPLVAIPVIDQNCTKKIEL